MVSLVLVTHSASLAAALQELALQMASGSVPIAIAGGIDDPQQTLGTDALRIQQAIESVYSEDGVLVLMDLGSAVLSAETALEFLPDYMKNKIRLCPAPLVEAAVVAAIHAQAGADLDRVDAEARNALSAKEAHLPGRAASNGGRDEKTLTKIRPAGPTEARKADTWVRVPNRLGIHARPAAKLVTQLSGFDAEVYLQNATLNSQWVNARSINEVAILDVQQGHELALSAHGPQANQVLAALTELIKAGFGEQETTAVERTFRNTAPSTAGKYQGQPASPGFALGPAAIYRLKVPKLPRRRSEDPQQEWQRLERGIATVRQNLIALQRQLALRSGGSETEIFDAHLLYLEDPLLLEDARRSIQDQSCSAESAWQNAANRIIDRYEHLTEPYLRERAADLADIRDQVLRSILGLSGTALSLAQASILIAPELSPADIIRLDPDKILGLCTALGGATSHSAILARSLGIPAVVGLGTVILNCAGQQLALEGSSGEVWIDPSREIRRKISIKRSVWLRTRRKEQKFGQKAALTQDGRHLQVEANIIGVTDARIALEYGADGIGVMRTEFLYLQRSVEPDEEEQYRAYSEIAESIGQRPLTIRTFDIGGDKQLPYLPIRSGANPFLGQRGARIYADYPDLLKTQLRAILRASPGHQIAIMLPMVSTCDEIRFVKKVLNKTREELSSEGKQISRSVALGIMIELPSAVALADQLAKESDFFSIGTNDLCQYTLAIDRTDPDVSGKYDSFHPALLRLVRDTVNAGHRAGIRVGLCGELAGFPEAVPLLVGLELDALSMNPMSIPAVKSRISAIRFDEAKELTLEVLDLESAEAAFAALPR